MEIGPIKHGRPVVAERGDQRDKNKTIDKPDRKGDTATISAESRSRLIADSLETEKKVGGPVSRSDGNQSQADLVGLIRERINSGFYELRAVKEKMVEKLTDEMLKGIDQFYK